MKMRRIVTAESKAGVVMQATDLLDSTTADPITNVWGFDQVPDLPLLPEVFGEYRKMGIFGPMNAIRVHVLSLPPETGNHLHDRGKLASKIDFGTGGGMTPGKQGGGMHRTDSIDLLMVLKGETDVDYPGEDGRVHSITLRQGDFVVQNGAFHEWRNRSNEHCVILVVISAAKRKPAG